MSFARSRHGSSLTMPMNDADGVELVETKSFDRLADVVEELTSELGERFPESIRNWCGIGRRPYPLDYWRVFLIEARNEAAGIVGLYRRDRDEGPRIWVGWFGIRPRFRGKGTGAQAMQKLAQIARADGFDELWTYTEPDNEAAIATYESVGFERQHVSDDPRTGRSADPRGQVLRLRLN